MDENLTRTRHKNESWFSVSDFGLIFRRSEKYRIFFSVFSLSYFITIKYFFEILERDWSIKSFRPIKLSDKDRTLQDGINNRSILVIHAAIPVLVSDWLNFN